MSQFVPATERERLPEHQLVRRAVHGEEGAFGQLYERHVEGVFNYVYFRVREEALAEDLTQDVFVRAFRGISGLRSQERFVAWLMRIAHNRVLNHWRDQSARPLPDALSAGGEPGAVAANTTPDPIEDLETRLTADAVLAATGELTDLQQQVIALRFVKGLSVAETAAIMQRSQSAVKNLQHHALVALRRQLATQEAQL